MNIEITVQFDIFKCHGMTIFSPIDLSLATHIHTTKPSILLSVEMTV